MAEQADTEAGRGLDVRAGLGADSVDTLIR
jgi:hypothetical protein